MPFAPKIIPQLLEALADPLVGDAAIAIDEYGQLQPLAGIYRSAPLAKALSSYKELTNQSVRSLLERLNINQVPLVETGYLIDIDTQEALSEAIALQSRLGL
jgi:molybdopterin-guanine dinucleotide biosynthesis protein A